MHEPGRGETQNRVWMDAKGGKEGGGGRATGVVS